MGMECTDDLTEEFSSGASVREETTERMCSACYYGA